MKRRSVVMELMDKENSTRVENECSAKKENLSMKNEHPAPVVLDTKIALEYNRLMQSFSDRGMLRVRDVMKFLKINKDGAYSLFNSEDFPSRNIGALKCISLSCFAAWLALNDKEANNE